MQSLAAILLLGATTAGDGAALCQGQDCVATRMGDDTFVAGGELRLDSELPGDALITGGSLIVRGSIDGDVAAAGGRIELSSTIGEDLYAAGGEVDVDGTIGGSARLAGGRVTLGPSSRIGEGVSLGAGRAVLEGTIGGYLQGGAGELTINGTIEGDVDVGTGELVLGPQARITGQLRYRSPEEAQIDPAAEVAGGIDHIPADDDWIHYGPESLRPYASVAKLVWLVGAALLGVIAILAAPAFSARSGRLARDEIGLVTVIGFAFLITVPAAAVLLMVTVIGIPLGIALLLGYGVATFLGWLYAIVALGDGALDRFNPAGLDRPGVRVVAFLLAFIAVALLAQLPWVGGLISLAVLVIGTGTFVLALWRSRRASTAAAT